VGQAAFGLPLLRRRADLALQARYLSRRRTLSGGSIPGHALLDLTFNSGELWPWLEFQVGLRNLLDRDYADPGSGEHVQEAIPQDGRTFFVTLRRRF
jgi:iron complex outermembrane receptor protein